MKPILACPILVGLALGGCGSSSNNGSPEAGADKSSAEAQDRAQGSDTASSETADLASEPGGDGATDGGIGACDPFKQDCMSGQKCDLGCMSMSSAPQTVCKADDGKGGAVDADCSPSAGCQKGLACLNMKCTKFCMADSDCPNGKTCQTASLTCGHPPDGGTLPSLSLHVCAAKG